MATTSFQLAEGVFYCLTGDQMVFLDLHRNRYLCLNQQHTRLATEILSRVDTPDTEPRKSASAVDSSEREKVARALSDRGLIVLDGTGIPQQTATVATPGNAIKTAKDANEVAFPFGHCVTFFKACFTASWKLSRFSIQRTVTGMKERKEEFGNGDGRNRATLRHLVWIFHYLRPLYSREYLCLFDSLALVEFLAHYRLFPDWVFGVRAEPFCAHCWVQDRECVLNDSVEYVCSFTPIMVI